MIPTRNAKEGQIVYSLQKLNFQKIIKIEDKQLLNEYANNDIISPLNYYMLEFTQVDLVVEKWKNLKWNIFKNKYGLDDNIRKNYFSEKNAGNKILFFWHNFNRNLSRKTQVFSRNEICYAKFKCLGWKERGFSTLKRTKTALRNRLGLETLDELMMIDLNGPTLMKMQL